MEQNITIRYAQINDAEDVARLIYATSLECCFSTEQPCPDWFRDSLDPNDIAKLINDERMDWLVALMDGRIVAVLAVKKKSHVTYFFVETACHKMGIGKQLWKNALQEGLLVDSLTVRSSLNAVAVYKRLGFVAVEPPKVYKGLHYQTMISVAGK